MGGIGDFKVPESGMRGSIGVVHHYCNVAKILSFFFVGILIFIHLSRQMKKDGLKALCLSPVLTGAYRMESSPERCLSGPRGDNGDSDEVLKDGRIDLMEQRNLD